MSKNTSFFSKRLISWYLKNKRSLPWRETKQAYPIWLSEIILQQTKVVQGLPYYIKFIETFPSLKDLANANEEQVLKLWQGMGYYSRARNLHTTAKFIYHDLNGIFPQDYKSLLQLKGVGDYTASAIASICYNEATAVVDGNVYRVLSRFFGIETPINSGEGIKYFKKLAQELIDVKQPGTHNQAIMEFGARHCIPKNPDCSSCIFNDKCLALKNNKATVFPIKTNKPKIKKLFFNYLIILSSDKKISLQQRTKKGIWQNLYEFPLIEAPKTLTLLQLKKTNEYPDFESNFSVKSISLYNEAPIIHKLSHRHIYTQFWIVETTIIKSESIPRILISELKNYPVPVLIENFILEFFFH